MTCEDLSKAIQFETKSIGNGLNEITASVRINSIQTYTDEVRNHPDIILQIKENAREALLRHIYQDQRQGLYEAIADLRRCNPFDHGEFQRACDSILRLAMRQPPSNP